MKTEESFTKDGLRYNLKEMVGEGTFGKVYKGTSKNDGDYKFYGIKKIIKNEDGLHITTIREIKYLRMCRHDNIINLLEINIDNSELFLIFPYYRFDLYSYLRKNILNRREIIHIIKQIAEGLRYLQSKNILHRDLKTKNILMDFDLNIKLADFGMPTNTNKSSSYSPGVVTLWYRPPEILLNMKYGFPADVWGLGCILGELMLGTPLFGGNTEIKVLDCIVSVCGSINKKSFPDLQDLDFSLPQSSRNLKTIFKNQDDDLVSLLDKILVVNPHDRINIDSILADNVFKGFDSDFINKISKRFKEGG